MKNISVILINKQHQNRQPLFLHDPKSDLLVVIREKVYPLHRIYLTDIQLLSSAQASQQKVTVLDPHINEKWFQVIVGYFYGLPLEFYRNWSIQELINTLQILRVPILLKKIFNDIKTNFDQYGFFLLVQIAYHFEIKWLKEQCEQELTLMNFEQLNYNRYDLFQLKRQTFQQIIKLHELLRVNQNIHGLSEIVLREICKQYCKNNSLPLTQVEKFLNPEDITADSISQVPQDNQKIRRRSNSQPQNALKNESTYILLAQSETREAQKSRTESLIQEMHYEDDKSSELYKLRVINSQIQQKNQKMLEQINKVKNVIKQPQTLQLANLDNFDEKFKKFQKSCQEQDEKFIKLKSEMEKLQPNLKKTLENSKERSKSGSNQKQKKQQASPYKKDEAFQIPKLNKD